MTVDAAGCCTFDETPEAARSWVRTVLDGHLFALLRGDSTVLGVFDDFADLTRAMHEEGEGVPLAPGDSVTYYAVRRCAGCGNVDMRVAGTVARDAVTQ